MKRISIIVASVVILSVPLHAQDGGGITTFERDASGHATYTSHPAGATILSFTKGDSILATRELRSEGEINAIVRFASPPLSAFTSQKQPLKRARLQSALAAIQSEHARFRSDLALLQATQARIRYEYATALNGMALTTTREILNAIGTLPYVRSVSEDGRVEAIDDSSNAVIGAPAFWNAYGITGDSIDIAILDTGIDYLHEALGGAPFPNQKVVGGYDIVNQDSDPMDDYGHGTHCAGIAAGNGPPPTNLRGVAYNARLWAFKVLDSRGSGIWSWVVAGIEKAMDPDGDPLTPTPIKVISMSLGGTGDPDDPISEAVDNAVNAGIVCAVAAGNWGSGYQTIATPGCARNALTVGATDNHDTIASFSSRGPSPNRYYIKPDVVAPGVDISSVNLGGGYIAHSGTSMATPHVAGAAALLLQLHPDWTPEEIKAVLMESAHDIGRDVWTQGSGRVDLMNAGAATIVVTPGSVSFGLIDDTLAVWTGNASLVLHNHSTSDDNFTISTSSPLPAGVTVDFSPPSVDIPAGTSTTVNMTITVDNAVFGYPGGSLPQLVNRIAVTASSTQNVYTVPFSFMKAPALTLIIDEMPWWLVLHDNAHRFYFYTYTLPTPQETLRYILPPGTYDLIGEYYDFHSMITRESIQLQTSQYIHYSKAQSRNAIVYQPSDKSGNPVSFLHTKGFLEIVQKQSRSGIILFGEGIVKYQELDFPDVSSNYMVDVKQQVYSTGNREYYQFSYGLQDGITAPVVLRTDPQNFTVVGYNTYNPPGMTAVYIFPSLEGINTGSIYTPFILTSPFQWKAYFTPNPFPEYVFKYTTFLMSVGPNPINGGDRMVYCTGRVTVEQPDTVKFFNYAWHTIPVYTTTANPVSVRTGYGAPRWCGRTGNIETDINLAPDANDTWGNFIGMLGDIAPGPLPYRLSSGGSPIDSGWIDFPWQTMVPKDLTVLPGQYQVEVSYDRFGILDTAGKASALLSFNTSAADKNPPFLKSLTIISNGAPAEYISPKGGELTFVPSDSIGLDSVGVSYQTLGDNEWLPAPIEHSGDSCKVQLHSLRADGYTSIRIWASDQTGNSLQYTIQPAFVYRFFTFDPETLWFGDVNLHEISQRTLSVTNPLSSAVTVASITMSDTDFSVTPSQCVIPPQGSQIFTFSFSPRRAAIQTCTVAFVHDGLPHPTIYQISGNGVDRRYRTFLPESLALARDMSGNAKGERQRADKVEFTVSITNNTGFPSRSLHVEFDQAVLEGSWTMDPPPEAVTPTSRGLKWDILFQQFVPYGSRATLSGFGSKGKTIKISRHWWLLDGIAQKSTSLRPEFTKNFPRLPMPNLNNVGETIYRMVGTGALGISVPGGKKFIRHSTYKDVLSTLSKRGTLHTLGPSCIDVYARGNPILGYIRNLPPDKHNNVLLADEIAFRMAILASDLSVSPPGLGDLIFNDGTDNPLNGMTLREIASVTDSFLILCATPRPGITPYVLDSTLKVINTAFSGPMDTVSFGTGLQVTGPRSLWTVPFVQFNRNAHGAPVRRLTSPEEGIPLEYALYQNYPNPFNPVTTIRFSLPEPALVTLSVYNVLGQLVATLLDHEAMPEDNHDVVFDAGMLASGVYFYRIRAEGFSEEGSQGKTFLDVRKMLLLK